MMTDPFPEYSDVARDAIDLFLFQNADAIFYFEDSNHEAVYERLIGRIFPNAPNVQVVCLGGKSKVIAKAKAQNVLPVTSLFILDKDFDDLLGEIQNLANVYYLNAYSLENYLLQVNALLHIFVEERPAELTMARAEKLISGWPDFFKRLQLEYSEVARLFIVARRFRVDIETTKMKVERLLVGAEAGWPIPTKEWTCSYRQELISRCHGNNEWLCDDQALEAQIEKAFLRDDGSCSPLVDSDTDHLSGKHLLGCSIRYLQSQLGVDLTKLDKLSFYIRLLGHIDLSPLDKLRSSILADHPKFGDVT